MWLFQGLSTAVLAGGFSCRLVHEDLEHVFFLWLCFAHERDTLQARFGKDVERGMPLVK